MCGAVDKGIIDSQGIKGAGTAVVSIAELNGVAVAVLDFPQRPGGDRAVRPAGRLDARIIVAFHKAVGENLAGLFIDVEKSGALTAAAAGDDFAVVIDLRMEHPMGVGVAIVMGVGRHQAFAVQAIALLGIVKAHGPGETVLKQGVRATGNGRQATEVPPDAKLAFTGAGT